MFFSMSPAVLVRASVVGSHTVTVAPYPSTAARLQPWWHGQHMVSAWSAHGQHMDSTAARVQPLWHGVLAPSDDAVLALCCYQTHCTGCVIGHDDVRFLASHLRRQGNGLHGQHMVRAWSAHGQHMVSTWSAHGQHDQHMAAPSSTPGEWPAHASDQVLDLYGSLLLCATRQTRDMEDRAAVKAIVDARAKACESHCIVGEMWRPE